MATCGYICPVCEGKGYLDNNTKCDWCTEKMNDKPVEERLPSVEENLKKQEEIRNWIKDVHEGPCCGDL